MSLFKAKRSFLLVFLLCSFIGYSQKSTDNKVFSPPISAEFLLGNDHFFFQSLVSKPISDDGKFGYTFVAAINTEYKVGEESKNVDIMIPVAANYKFYKDLAANAGVAFNPAFGNRPFLGLRYVKVNDTWTVVVVPSFYFSKSQYYETLASVEFQPKINASLKLYTRLQALYSFDVNDGSHDRSYFFARIGVNYKKTAFGLGYNWDSYGPYKVNYNNFGVFVKSIIF